tara:strand:+ start:57 stop:281 length:225 start_codon:yes stop_codon:yes gene_type:complete
MKNDMQANVQVDLTKAETMKCKKCDNAIFIPSFILKRLSPLVSPTGKEAVIPVQVYSCGNCGEVIKSLISDDII